MAMPDDLQGGEVGAPELCAFHSQVIHNLEHLDHIGDRDSDRVAIQLAKQCCTTRRKPS